MKIQIPITRCPNCGQEHFPILNNAYCENCSNRLQDLTGRGFIDATTGKVDSVFCEETTLIRKATE